MLSMTFVITIAVLVGAVVVVLLLVNRNRQLQQDTQFADAIAEARRWNERLGSQVLTMTGTDAASTQAIGDAAERHNAAAAQIASATTVRQAELARESALEGLYYMNAARDIMGMPAGPELPPLEGQRAAGKVTEERTITHEGQQITASPVATADTPNYYPGGMVAGRPVPAGWYSRPWWADALQTGIWTAGSVMLFSAMFQGMAGVSYPAAAFEQGYAEGLSDAAAGAEGATEQLSGDEGGFFDGIFGGGDSGGDSGGDGGFLGGMFDGDGGMDFDVF